LKTHVSLFLALAIQDSARMPWHDTSLTIIGELGGFFRQHVLWLTELRVQAQPSSISVNTLSRGGTLSR
jgi:hypothetical protein